MIKCKQLIYRKHALERMLKRNVEFEEVELAILNGEIIKEYPDDKPFGSYLVLAILQNKNLHVVVSQDEENNCYVISVYEPDINLWNNDLKTKKI